MIYDEIWAVPVYRIEEFFQREDNMTSKNSVHGTAYFLKIAKSPLRNCLQTKC